MTCYKQLISILLYCVIVIVVMFTAENLSFAQAIPGKGGVGSESLSASIHVGAQSTTVERDYKTAFCMTTSGAAYDAALLLIDMNRKCPSDDFAMAEALIGPGQLLGFIIASLMDWPERSSLLNHVLEPDTYPTDKLLIAVMKAGSGIQTMAATSYAQLIQLTQGEHQAVKVAALGIISSPYYFPKRYMREAATGELALRYPQLNVTRYNTEGSVFKMLRLAKEQGEHDVYLLKDVVYGGGIKDRIMNISPGLHIAAEYLPTMNVKDITDDVVAAWAQALLDETDPETRYTLLCLLEYVERSDTRRASMRPVLQTLVRPNPQTPDQVRARLLLAEIDREERRTDALRGHIEYLMPKDVLPTIPERSLYENSLHSAQRASTYFIRYGFHADAVRTHQHIAARFPDTNLEKVELEKVSNIQADPLKACLDTIRNEARQLKRKGGDMAVEELYNDVIRYTENASLKHSLRKEIVTV